MSFQKFLGFILLGISIILALAIVGQLPKLVGTIFGIGKIFTGELSDYEMGKVFGKTIYWILHIALTLFLWVKGRKMIKTK